MSSARILNSASLGLQRTALRSTQLSLKSSQSNVYFRLTTSEPVPSAPAAEESKETPQSKKPVKKIPKVTICVNKKNFNRSVTIVTGLEAFGE